MSPRRSYHLSDPPPRRKHRRTPGVHRRGGLRSRCAATVRPATGPGRPPRNQSSKHWPGSLSATIRAFGGSPQSPRKSATVVRPAAGVGLDVDSRCPGAERLCVQRRRRRRTHRAWGPRSPGRRAGGTPCRSGSRRTGRRPAGCWRCSAAPRVGPGHQLGFGGAGGLAEPTQVLRRISIRSGRFRAQTTGSLSSGSPVGREDLLGGVRIHRGVPFRRRGRVAW